MQANHKGYENGEGKVVVRMDIREGATKPGNFKTEAHDRGGRD